MMDPAAMDQSPTQDFDFEKVVSCGPKVTRRILCGLTLKEVSNLATASSAAVFKAIFDSGHRTAKGPVSPSSHSCTESLPDAKDSDGLRLWTGSEADVSFVIEAIGRGMVDATKKSYGQQVAIHIMDSLSNSGVWDWCNGDDALAILSATGILVNSLLRLEPQEAWRSAIKTIVGPFLREKISTLIGPDYPIGVSGDLEDLVRSVLHHVLWRHIPDESKGQVIEIVLEEFGFRQATDCSDCRIQCQSRLFFVWFRPNCLGSYNDTCWQKQMNLWDADMVIDHLGPQHLEVFLGPMAKALSIIYKTIQDRGGNEEQLNDFWVFLEKLFDIVGCDFPWVPDNFAAVLFLASKSFRLWFLNMTADNLKGSGEKVDELARTAALLVVLASKFDRLLDQVSTTIIQLVTDARLADHSKTFIKEFWATLMASLELAMESSRRPKLLTAVTKFGQAMMPFAYPPPVTIKKRTGTPSTSTGTASTSASSEGQGRRAASTSNAKMWSGEE